MCHATLPNLGISARIANSRPIRNYDDFYTGTKSETSDTIKELLRITAPVPDPTDG